MIRLRPYKSCDASAIVRWCRTEREFRLWCSDRFEYFPISSSDVNNKYFEWNGDCVEADNFYPMTAFDENGVVGHLFLRYINGDRNQVRLGLVIVDNLLRGQGYGKEMVKMAVDYSFQFLKAEKVKLGVFDCNMQAYYCFTSAGFRDIQVETEETHYFNDEKWTVLELEMTREEYENRNSRSKVFKKF